jgi:hypothetical protein
MSWLGKRKTIRELPLGMYEFVQAKLEEARDNYQDSRFNETDRSSEFYKGQMSAWMTMLNRLDSQ